MPDSARGRLVACAAIALVIIFLGSWPASAHPLGNFSISHYAGILVDPSGIEIRYFIDMAEIPTFQEIQETEIVPDAGHPSLAAYRERMAEAFKEHLILEVNGQRLALQNRGASIIFPPGAGGLPTLKIGVVYRADVTVAGAPVTLRYRDLNFDGRAGWKEIVAIAGPGVVLQESSVPATDRSRELSDYPTDLLNSPPQALEAHVVFVREGAPTTDAALESPPAPPVRPRGASPDSQKAAMATRDPGPPLARKSLFDAEPAPATTIGPIQLQPNIEPTPRNSFTEMAAARELRFSIVMLALFVAAGLGAVHALEPGHGKTVVAAYLVGSRGTAWHALWLGLIVTASHTAGVYLLGAVTLYASRYVLPERLYPWLGVISGVTIAGLGVALFLRRYAGGDPPHHHTHDHHHAHARHAHSDDSHTHRYDDKPSQGTDADHHVADASVSARQLVALGVTGGIVPCPAALVVLLSAASLGRVAFGLLLIVAFSLGLAAVLVVIGVLMVYARRFMSRFHGDGPLITRWLPLASSAVIACFGIVIAVQALVAAGILAIRL